MSNSSIQHFIELASPVDASIVSVLRAVDAVAQERGHSYFLVGAMARHVLLVNTLGLPPARATVDIDFGLAVESWEQFDDFKRNLGERDRFRVSTKHWQRLYYRDIAGKWEIPVDLIPFGPIASTDKRIAWPPDRDIVMSVAGFDEALRAAVLVDVDEGLTVKVASLPGLTVLKFTAWVERGRANNRDAADLYTMLATYAVAGNSERLYTEELKILENADFDLELAGAQLLGRDVAQICGKDTLRFIADILQDEQLTDELITQISQVADPFGDYPHPVSLLLERFHKGLRELL
jgi:predicted nucleotidyltransferase